MPANDAPYRQPAYLRDPAARSLDTELIAIGHDDRGSYLVLADTILYPEGGGQPADRGTVDGQPIGDVQRVAGEIRHYLTTAGAPLAAGPVSVALDWPRRWDHMQQHSAQHLLTAVAADRFGWSTLAFHLSRRQSDIELSVPALTAQQIEALETEANAEVRAARRIRARLADPEALAGLEVRSRGLPEGLSGPLRLVEIDGLDCCTCGGTHLGSTAEIEAIKLLGTESMRGGTRLAFVAGARLRRRLGCQEQLLGDLRQALGAPDDALVSAVADRAQRMRELERRLRETASRLVEHQVAGLLGQVQDPVHGHFADSDMAALQQVAASLASAGRCALLTAGGPTSGIFALALGDSEGRQRIDLPTLGADVAAALGGRGGGRGQVYQGRADRLDGLERAMDLIRRALRPSAVQEGATSPSPPAVAPTDRREG
ncbi:MAG: alanyl-tRNA editing protein [Caldilineae bacterium]|nr:alanyl-tRNA editing protein [Caldilineae bacterium]